MNFNYQEWATRNVRPDAHKYSAGEHCLYIAASLLMLAICVGVLYWAVWYLVALFANAIASTAEK